MTKEFLLESLRKLNHKLSAINWSCVSIFDDDDVNAHLKNDKFEQVKSCVDYMEQIYVKKVPRYDYENYVKKYSFKQIQVIRKVRKIPEKIQINENRWKFQHSEKNYDVYMKQ